MHLAGPYFEIESIDRTHAAKAQRHLFERERAGFRRSIEQSPDQIGPRDDGAVAFEWAAVLKIQHLGNSTGDCQHDDEEQHCIEKCRPCDQRCCKLRQHGE